MFWTANDELKHSFRCLSQRKRKRCRKIFLTADLSRNNFKDATLQERRNRENYRVFQDSCLFALAKNSLLFSFFLLSMCNLFSTSSATAESFIEESASRHNKAARPYFYMP